MRPFFLMMPDFLELQKKIKVRFKKKDLLIEACTHRSYPNENPSWELPHNERLEFLGDAVLELITTVYLFKTFPGHDEGRLTSVRAALVNTQSLANTAREIGLDEYVLMSRGEAQDRGRARDVILANAFEALLGAMYLDQGYEKVKIFVDGHILYRAQEIVEHNLDKDPKSLFQEIAQERFKVTPSYRVLKETGPEHNKRFIVGVFLEEKEIAQGEGYSKQQAETEAAQRGLYALKAS